ncbi:hypothetical protein BU26DRAFT_50436 [Trematosphaeria pertusa]|uniref:Uncharacterized protein n=1 Tax=Trematosphaeria pertusa TaxID=390896 RepID=A0A6A6IAW3_9PLEO|nr:uncharacterized protein BU26DRAFT_50436 [Trematosphaeria pertusa]KAF2246633.1 hypothetical protein BU26DRAFT_50436 [Trematosphaeria pertusa]
MPYTNNTQNVYAHRGQRPQVDPDPNSGGWPDPPPQPPPKADRSEGGPESSTDRRPHDSPHARHASPAYYSKAQPSSQTSQYPTGSNYSQGQPRTHTYPTQYDQPKAAPYQHQSEAAAQHDTTDPYMRGRTSSQQTGGQYSSYTSAETAWSDWIWSHDHKNHYKHRRNAQGLDEYHWHGS